MAKRADLSRPQKLIRVLEAVMLVIGPSLVVLHSAACEKLYAAVGGRKQRVWGTLPSPGQGSATFSFQCANL